MGQFLNSREPYDKYRTVILELKVDHTPEEAIAQIKEKEYGFKENIIYNKDFIEYYASIVNEYLNIGSRSNYSAWNTSLNYFKVFAGNKLQANLLDQNHVKKYRAFLLETKNLRTQKKKLSRNTAAAYYKNFIFILKKAYKQGIRF